jgi:hypothetical protein
MNEPPGFLPESQNTPDEAPVDDRLPLLYVDVNLGGIEGAQPERIVVFEGDTAAALAAEFCDRHNLDEDTQVRLEALLNQQIASVLTKIREEEDDGGLNGQQSTSRNDDEDNEGDAERQEDEV